MAKRPENPSQEIRVQSKNKSIIFRDTYIYIFFLFKILLGVKELLVADPTLVSVPIPDVSTFP